MCLCVCVCWRGPVCVCVSEPALAIVKSPSRRTGRDTCLGYVHTQRQMWLYMIKCLLKRRQSKCRDKERGQTRRNGMKTVWQKQANSVVRKRVQERLTDRRVRIIDRGSDRESMWWWDNRQIDGFCLGREEEGARSQAGRRKRCLFVQSCKAASKAPRLPLHYSVTTEKEREERRRYSSPLQSMIPAPSHTLSGSVIHLYWLLINWLEERAMTEWCWSACID